MKYIVEESIQREEELIRRLRWFINLRWVTVVSVLIITVSAEYLFDLSIPAFYVHIGNIFLLFYNCVFYFYNKKLSIDVGRNRFRKINMLANFQITLDIVMLSYFMHFTGSIENPFVFYFIFHMVFASILLSNRAAYVQASFAVCLLGGLISGEYFRIIPHYHLGAFFKEESFFNPLYVMGEFAVFASVLYITVYMATSIINRLRLMDKQLEVANTHLKEQDRLKSQYVLTVSHELQSSLSTVQICLKVILEGMTGIISAKTREMAARAELRCVQIINFVKDLLSLSRIRAGREMQKNNISMSEVAKRAIEQTKQKIKEKNINLIEKIYGKGLNVIANEDSMEQLLVNLLTNACKYTPYNGKIEISLMDTEESLVGQVEDTGIGISHNDIPRIFDDFYRAENAVVFEKDGTGLGLTIVKQIIENHNGKIWVESQIGKGTRFIFALPKTG